MKNFKLRLSLFRIWFVKNIVVFLQIIAITLFILVFTGVLPESTPIFGSLISEIRAAEGDSSRWIHVVSVFISCIGSASLFMARAKSIALSDIKNDNLKLALVNANMYFNEQGRLVKKIEKAANTDINGDGKIDEKDIPEEDKPENAGAVKITTNLFTGVKNMVQEFFAIATVNLDENDEEKAKKQADDVIKDNNMREAAQAVHEIDNIKVDAHNKQVDNIVDKHIEEASKDIDSRDITEADKQEQKSIFKRSGEWLKNLFHREKKHNTDFEKPMETSKKENTEEQKTDNKPAKEINKPAITKEIKQEDIKPEVKEERKTPTKPVTLSSEDFLAKLRRGNQR